MKTKLMAITAGSILLLTLPIVFAASGIDKRDNAHKYTIGVQGTAGVKLRMLIVAKPSAAGAPTRESEIITIPFHTTREAHSFYVWFDTLEGGASGSDGDRVEGTFEVDGELQGGGCGITIKRANTQSCGFGNL